MGKISRKNSIIRTKIRSYRRLFYNSLEGFNNFTSQAERVVSEAISVGNVRNISGKTIYYIDGVANPKKGVIVIIRVGLIQSMMPSDFKSFIKMQ